MFEDEVNRHKVNDFAEHFTKADLKDETPAVIKEIRSWGDCKALDVAIREYDNLTHYNGRQRFLFDHEYTEDEHIEKYYLTMEIEIHSLYKHFDEFQKHLKHCIDSTSEMYVKEIKRIETKPVGADDSEESEGKAADEENE